jgi:hypothetical protein
MVCKLWVMCCVPPPVSNVNDDSLGVLVPVEAFWL